MDDTAKQIEHAPARSLPLYRIGTWGAISMIGYFLLTEHLAHVIQALPWLLILACPLMHIFMHHGHGGHDHRDEKGTK